MSWSPDGKAATGWAASDAQDKFGVDFAFMKERYNARALIEKLTELLEQAAASRFDKTPMENLGGSMEPFPLETQLLRALAPHGGVQTIYTLVSRCSAGAIPIVAEHPDHPLEILPGDVSVGLYWSRALSTAVAVGLGPAAAWPDDRSVIPETARAAASWRSPRVD